MEERPKGLSMTYFWSFLLLWQLLWLPQSGPGLKPDPIYWWSAMGLGVLSVVSALRGRLLLTHLCLLAGGLAALATVSSVLFRCLVFWSYWAAFIEAARSFRRQPGRAGRVLLSAFLCSFGLQLFLLFGEVGMRILSMSSDLSRIPCLSYGNTPWITGKLYNHERNSLGLREREIVQFKPPDQTRVLFVGDSVTFGLGIALEDTFVRLVEPGLGPGVQTINLSAPSANLEKEYLALTTTGQFYEPDVVVWVYFPNDIEYTGMDIGYAGFQRSLDSLYRSWIFYEYLKSQYHIFLGRIGLRTSYLSVLQAAYSGPAYQQFSSQIDQMAFWCQRNKKRFAVVVFPFMEDLDHYPLLDAHRRVIESVNQLGVPCLDLMPVFQGRQAEQLQLNPMFDHHPNRQANKLAAEAIIPFLKTVLR